MLALAARAARALKPSEASALVEHLSSCPDCRKLETTIGHSDTVGDTNPASSGTDQLRDPARGDSIDRFLVVSVLGSGGMGVVYSAYDPMLDRKVAIKLLRDNLAGSEHQRTRLLREAQAMARIKHPNVIKVHEVGTFRDQVYLAMEFAEAGTLRGWLAGGKRSRDEILGVFAQAGRGLAAAHAAGLFHRDFKPDNVLLAADGTVLVTDFGLVGTRDTSEPSIEPLLDSQPPSRDTPLSQQLTRTGAVMGTPAYMAPEQFDGRANALSDQFSFCVALYEALYSQRPFGGDSYPELSANVATGAIRPPPRSSQVPAWQHRVLERGLATDPDDRYPTITELLDALTRDPQRRRRWIAGAAAAAVAVVGAAVAIAALSSSGASCGGGDDRIATAWGARHRAAVLAAFVASGRPDAGAVLARVVPAVDGWATSWQDAYLGACEDTHVRGIQSEQALDLRMQCLGRALDDARATVDAFAAGGGDAVDHAIDMARALPDTSACADTAPLGAVAPPGAGLRPAVAALRDQLAAANAQDELARFRPALALARGALDGARPLGYRPLIAEAEYALGKAQARLEDRAAGDTLRDAMASATAAGMSELTVRAAAGRLALLRDRPAQFGVADEIVGIAAAIAERERLPTRVAVTLESSVGRLLVGEGKYDQAKTKLEQAAALATRELGSDSPATIAAVGDLAELAAATHHYDDARRLYVRVRDADQRIYGPAHPTYADALDNVANVDAERGESNNALAIRQQTLAIRIAALGPDNPQVARSYSYLAQAELKAGNLPEAKRLLELAVEIVQRFYGDEHAETLTLQIDLGRTLNQVGEQDRARTLLETAMATSERLYAADDPRLAWVLDDLGLVARHQHRWADALAYWQRAERITEQAFGPNDPKAADFLGEIASTYTKMKDLDRARDATARVVAIMAKVYGDTSTRYASALGNQGQLQLALKDGDGAIASFQQAGAIFQAKLGDNAPSLALCLQGQARALLGLGRSREAVPLLERTVAIVTVGQLEPRQVGDAHWYLAIALADVGERARARKEGEAALAAYRAINSAKDVEETEAWLRKH
jgi:tetratricopeptide (TPR) repeat protein